MNHLVMLQTTMGYASNFICISLEVERRVKLKIKSVCQRQVQLQPGQCLHQLRHCQTLNLNALYLIS